MKYSAMFLLLVALSNRAYTQAAFPVDTAKLAERAKETTSISLDKNMLQFAGKFLSSDDEDREAQQIIAHLDGIYVRTYGFKKPNTYSPSEVEAFRRQLTSSGWSCIVSERGKKSDEDTEESNEDTDIYVHLDGKVKGMFILVAEPSELTFIHIAGAIKAEDLDKLSGNFGIPKTHVRKEQPQKEDQR
jgi:hypothetical protein